MSQLVVLHGVESVGKSTLAAQLAERLGAEWVPEYGRAYCEEHGTDLEPRDLVAIAEGQQAMIEAARETAGPVLISDTDWLMTSAWNRLLFDQPLSGAEYPIADLYLHLPPDLPWVDDGLRFVGSDHERKRFDAICRDELGRRGARVAVLDAPQDERLEQALAVISDM